ncbi:MGT family glycosyltransferase [Crossiella equi]|uniref:MGT family glycosyltransferase n=1 Tax=Crossiella equi TaxID=130796 RepID=A0ABS5A8C6_9PSEU|nr:glycosyltransferase [Crossiella equi]MBP2472845.1 MGT family glycosyltransferase [Crossiella equi]
MRVLFVVPPLHGHVNPTVSLAASLRASGHEVAWAGHGEFLAHVLGGDAEVFDCATPALIEDRPADLRGPGAFKFLWETFLIPLAQAMLPDVEAAVEAFKPDLLVADQQAMAGPLVALRLGLPWVTSATTSAEFTDPFRGMPKVIEWQRQTMADLRARAGVTAEVDLRYSPHLVLAFTSRELVGELDGSFDEVAFVGPATLDRPEDTPFPWERLDARAAVLVSLGTANAEAGQRFIAEAATGLGTLADEVLGIVVDPLGVVTDPPPNVVVVPRVPQLKLLPRLSAVVCHGGHNTVCETLAHGLPLVVAPIRDDQPVIAQQVADAGAGVRLRFTRATASHIATAVSTVLDEPDYREAARRIAGSFAAAGGPDAVVRRLEALSAQVAPAAKGRISE